jgi:3'-5' exoribonuclease
LREESATGQHPAWLMHLAISDWECEMDVLKERNLLAGRATINACMEWLTAEQQKVAARHVLHDPQWQTAYGSSVGTPHAHHAYPGGLLVHTAEVMNMVLCMDGYKDPVPLIFAALYHDWGKVKDYSEAGERTTHYHNVGHIVASYEHWRAASLVLSADLSDRVGHIILSHHGRREWGSPVEPQTEEAYIFHQADMWSAKWGPGR